MYADDPNKPSYDPCELVKTKEGCETLLSLIESTGYVVKEPLFRAFCIRIALRKPLMLCGHRGGGKSEFPLAIYQGCNIPCFWLQCREGYRAEDILYRWLHEQQNQFVLQAVGSGSMSFEEAFEQQWSRRFLKLGAVAAAFEYAARQKIRPLLVIDEEDKLGPIVEDMFLEPFQFGRVSIEGYSKGYVGFAPGSNRKDWPIIIVTSNDLRNDASSPFRSRCMYYPINLPDGKTQVDILRSRFPHATYEQVLAVTRMFSELQLMTGLRDKPNVREALDVMESCMVEGVTEIDEQVVEDYAGLLVKRQSDYEVLSKRYTVERLASAANRENKLVDQYVEASFNDVMELIE
jgi:MoxR-like ATPase